MNVKKDEDTDSAATAGKGDPEVGASRRARRILWFWHVPRWAALAYRIGLTAVGAYILLFTFAWGMVVELVIYVAFSLVHANVPKAEIPLFRPYVLEQPMFRAMCDFGNRVADLTRPLISDEAMIAHWQQHHKEWEEALGRQPVQGRPEDYRLFDEYLKSIGLERLHYDVSDNPERFANMIPLASLGRRQDLSRPCTGRGGSSKGYRFYPQNAPVVFGNQVFGASTLDFAKANNFQPTGNLLVESNDRPHYTYSMRPLSARWFIMRWE